MRADATGDVAVCRGRRDDGCIVIAHMIAGQAQQLGMDAVLDRQRAELEDPVRERAKLTDERLQDRGGDPGVVGQHLPEDARRHRRDHRIVQRHDVGRARVAVDRRELAERPAGRLLSALVLPWSGRQLDRFDLRRFTLAVCVGLTVACLVTAATAGVVRRRVASPGGPFGRGLG